MPTPRSTFGLLLLCVMFVPAAAPQSGPVAASATLAGAGLPAPSVRVTAPVLAYLSDQKANSLRPLAGVPGSGFPGAVMDFGLPLAAIEIAPSQLFGLAASAFGGHLYLLRLDDLDGVAAALEGSIGSIDQIAISPTGDAAVVYSSATRRAQVWTGLPGAPTVARENDWTGISGQVTALAVSDDASEVQFAATDTTTSLYSVAGTGIPLLMYDTPSPGSLTYFHRSLDSVLTVPGEEQVVWVRRESGVANPSRLRTAYSGVSGLIGALPSEDGRRIFAAYRSGHVVVTPLSGDEAQVEACGCQPSQLRRARGRDVFLLTTSLESPRAVLNGDNDKVEVVFVSNVPPRAATAGGEEKR